MKKASQKKTGTHVAMRIGSYQDRQLGKGVIEAHNEVAVRNGTVYLGKAGRGLSEEKVQRVRGSLADGVACYLILIRRSKSGYECYSSPIASLPPASFSPDLRRVPAYYHDLAKDINLWIEIGTLTPINATFLESLTLVSNSRSLRDTLDSCRTSLMLVRRTD